MVGGYTIDTRRKIEYAAQGQPPGSTIDVWRRVNMNAQGMTKLAMVTAIALSASLSTSAIALQANVVTKGKVTVYTLPAAAGQAAAAADIANARPMPLPTVDLPALGPMEGGLSTASLGVAGFRAGALGNGQTSPTALPLQTAADRDELQSESGNGIAPQEYGTANHPFTTMRVDSVGNNLSKTYPYAAVGKLYFNDGASRYMCTASLIKRGVVVTAAHCVAAFGQKRFYTNFQFIPALYDSSAPYGVWNWASATVMTSYFAGTDSCAARGVVCQNDVAVIRLAPQGGQFPGTSTGWLGYGWDGYGFTPNNLALIDQLGYPASHDSGLRMQRTDSQGFVSASYSGNTVWGSRQTGGSSGGPEVVNLGILPVLSTSLGYEASANVVVGVTSWGYTDAAIKQQGASPFTSSNIVPLINTICASQAACQ
jgi:V8-like Glu-specific endopeptidase